MDRVGGLKTLVKTGARTRDLNGLTPVQQLRQIRQEVRAHYEDQYRFWRTMLEPALTGRGIRYRRPEQIAGAGPGEVETSLLGRD